MTPAQLIALCEKATPGPWVARARAPGVSNVWQDACPEGAHHVESDGTVFALGVAVACTAEPADAAFIAAARTAVPQLLAALAAMRPVAVGTAIEEVLRQIPDGTVIKTAKLEAMQARIALLEEALRLYVDEFGEVHDDPACPEDDTCTCPFATKVRAAFEAMR